MTAAGAIQNVIYPMMLQIILFGLAAGGCSHYIPADGLLWQWCRTGMGGTERPIKGGLYCCMFPISSVT